MVEKPKNNDVTDTVNVTNWGDIRAIIAKQFTGPGSPAFVAFLERLGVAPPKQCDGTKDGAIVRLMWDNLDLFIYSIDTPNFAISTAKDYGKGGIGPEVFPDADDVTDVWQFWEPLPMHPDFVKALAIRLP